MGCVATGLSHDAPAVPPVTTTQTFTYTGAAATSFFSAVPLVTNSASLMTYTPGAASSSSTISTTPSNATVTSQSANAASPIVVASSTTPGNGSLTTAGLFTGASATPASLVKSAGVAPGVGNSLLGVSIF